MKYFVRDDGSCNHIVRFNPETGEYIDNPAGQGCASGSSWSRGQSWALYGFTLSYMMTGKKEYLDTAIKVANYFTACCSVTDWVPDCDFRQPRDIYLKDNAAGGVAACGLMELAKLLPETQGATYRAAGCRLLKAMVDTCCDWTEVQPAILTKCTGSFSAKDSHHITMNYADYFMIEAFNKVLGKDSIQFWAPDAHEFPVR